MIPVFSMVGCSSEGAPNAKYDVVLCSGKTENGDHYQLVGTQTESTSGVSIKIGVLKNGNWLIPLSSDSRFLGDDGLFHIRDTSNPVPKYKAVDLYSVSGVFTFMNNGSFLMESYTFQTLGYDKGEYIFLSCVKKDYIAVDLSKYHFPSIDRGLYKDSFTDNGKVIGYDYNNISGRYVWYLLDIDNLSLTKIASDMKCCPSAPLSDGLFFASDDCFYNTSGQNVIDLSHYNIVETTPMFIDRTAMITIKNNAGRSCWIRIDKQGNVIQEEMC